MTIGKLITAARYNTLQNRVAVVMGVGSGSSGYGQQLVSKQKPTGSIVNLSDMINLRTDMLRARQHQTGIDNSSSFPLYNSVGSFGTITGGSNYTNGTYQNVPLTVYTGTNPYINPTANIVVSNGSVTSVNLVSGGSGIIEGTTFTALASAIGGTGTGFFVTVNSLSNVILDSHYNFTEENITLIENNKSIIASNQATLSNVSKSIRTTEWNSRLVHRVLIDFGSANDARYFFNTGGEVQIHAKLDNINSIPTGSKIYSWYNLINSSIGIIKLKNNTTSTSGTGTTSNIGFYNLTSSPQQLFIISPPIYSINTYKIFAYCNVANNSVGGARYVTVEIQFNDDDISNNDINNTGTLTSYVDILRPTGTIISGITGITIPLPIVTTTNNL